MTITLPTRMPDGTTQDVEYLPLDEVVLVLPVHLNTARRKLAKREWHGAHFGGRWYMTHDDIADAVADARGEGTYTLTDDQPPTIGAAVDDDGLDDVGGVS